MKNTRNQADLVSPARAAALAMFQSCDPFSHLRGALARVGLAGAEKFGLGVFFAMSSRFGPSPFRVAIHETTEGSAKHLVQCAAKLLEPGAVCGVCSDRGWSRFVEDPTHRIAYVKQSRDGSTENVGFETYGNQLVRVSLGIRDGQVVKTPEIIEGRFACFAEQYPWESPDRLRWLTIQLPAPPLRVQNGIRALDDDEIEMWREVQRLLQQQAKRRVVLPDWADVMGEQIHDVRGRRYLPVFLRAWRTMATLRSIGQHAPEGDMIGEQNMLLASFEDLAVTSLLVRRVFREGSWFPSPAKIYREIFPVGEARAVINPLTGKGVRYVRTAAKLQPWDFVNLDVM